ncbi:MAG: hypothetical protein K8R69_09740, partial [Deltaproteobacteria bacterium]|nr:hypothetical protein [Deltaproteobacteria bacterium]
MFHSFRSLLLSFFVLAAQPIAFAHADQLTVEDPGDSGKPTQLRALINQAKDGDVIVIPGGMTVKIQIDGVEDQNQSGDFDLNKNIQITGAGAQVSAIEGDAQSRIFDIADGKTVSLSDLTLRNGTSTTGGAIRNKGGTLNLDSVHLTQNSAPQGDGGALYQVKGITNIAASSFTANEAKNGGALYVAAGNVHLENSTLGKNSATDLGGGAIVINGAVLNVNYATISKNSAAEGGGIWGGGTLQNSIVSENTGTVGKADIRSANGVDSRGNNLVGDVTDGIFTKAGDSVGADVQLLALSEDEALPFFPVDALSP